MISASDSCGVDETLPARENQAIQLGLVAFQLASVLEFSWKMISPIATRNAKHE